MQVYIKVPGGNNHSLISLFQNHHFAIICGSRQRSMFVTDKRIISGLEWKPKHKAQIVDKGGCCR